ncbi:MAG: HIT family protein [Lewinellaceae bacterium]|nr:HIT family protein [Saprospiraceae bacterium]MCB9313640.1 HIT family protein [Lewinellaceae bacterium]HRW74445.1 HIT family protein [Saprospiraceae bacterium]
MATLFTRIIEGEIPCYKLAEDQHYFAFLDIRPLTKGHALVIPKQESDYIFRMDDQALSGLMVFAKRVALALEQEVSCARIGVAVIGLEVPHTHVHLVPINEVGDINFKKPPVDVAPAEMEDLAMRVAQRCSGQ